VGVWVGHIAGDVLRRRSEQIARIEGAPSTPGLVVAAAVLDPVTTTDTLEAAPQEAKTELVPGRSLPDAEATVARGTGRAVLPVVLGTAVVGILAGLAFVGTRGSNPGPGVSPSGQAASVDVPAATDVPSASAAVAPTASATPDPGASPAASASISGPTLPRTLPTPPRPRSKTGAPAAPNCNPPYYEDPSGIRRVKPQCL
jgi:hypothetical protein